MGQGLYTLLGYGVLEPPRLEDDDAQDELLGAVQSLGLRTGYETVPDYLVIPLAVDDGFLQDEWHLPDLPDMLPHPKRRTARELDHGLMTPYLVGWLTFPHPSALGATWQEAQRLYANAGLTLGEPGVIVLNDWD